MGELLQKDFYFEINLFYIFREGDFFIEHLVASSLGPVAVFRLYHLTRQLWLPGYRRFLLHG